nr:MAG TPA: hypothetical protein [Caudoviricetes sp.]
MLFLVHLEIFSFFNLLNFIYRVGISIMLL